MKPVVHVVARAVADDPHTLGVLALSDAMQALSPSQPLPQVSGSESNPLAFAAAGATAVDGAEPLAALPAAADATVVYHQNRSAPQVVRQLVARGGSIAVADGGVALDPIAELDLRALAAAGATALATSAAAEARFAALGFASVRRVPVVVARDRLRAVEAFAPMQHHLDVAIPGPLIVAVDDLASATASTRAVQAYHVLRTYLLHAGHLAVAVVPTPDTDEAAVQTLCREIWGLRLTDAWAHRLVAVGERAALTRRATVFVTADPAVGDVRHALAAMAEGVPVVAPANETAAETLGDGALLLPADASPSLVAEALADVLADESLHARWRDAGGRVIAQFDPALVAPAWLEALPR